MAGTGLTTAEWEALASRGRAVRYRRGEVLFTHGEPGERVLAIRSGRVKVLVSTPAGREVLLAMKGPGDLVGELSALDGRPRSATAVAVDAVEALALAPSAFDAFLDDHPRLAVRLLRALAGQLREATHDRAAHAGADVGTRLAARLAALARQAAEHGSEDQPRLALTQDDLAAWIGATREATNRALAGLRAAGAVDTGRGWVRVLDLAALEDHAEG